MVNVCRAPADKLTPDLLEWARAQLNEEEIAADVREIRETGGMQLDDFIAQVEEEA